MFPDIPAGGTVGLEETGREVRQFGNFALDLGRGALVNSRGQEIPLRPKPFALLRLLVENGGMLVTREAIMAAVWPGVFVSDDSIAQCVKEIRRALEDNGQTIVKTIPKRGFRFEAAIQDHSKILSADMPIGRPPAYKDDEPVEPLAEPGGVSLSGRIRENTAAKRAPRADDLTTLELRNIATPKLGAPSQVIRRQEPMPLIDICPLDVIVGGDEGGEIAACLTRELFAALQGYEWLSLRRRAPRPPALVSRDQEGPPALYCVEGHISVTHGKGRVVIQLLDAIIGLQLWAGTFLLDTGSARHTTLNIAHRSGAEIETKI